MTDAFVKFPKSLMQATHWVSLNTGALITLTPMQKILWLHFKDRFDFFNGRGQAWYENQQSIADTLGCSRDTVIEFVKALELHGYFVTTKRVVQGCVQSNAYTIVADLEVQHVQRSERARRAVVIVPALPVEMPQHTDDDADDPFANVQIIPTRASGPHAGISDMHL